MIDLQQRAANIDIDDLTLSSHPLNLLLMDRVEPALKKAIPRLKKAVAESGKLRSTEPSDLADREQYYFNVFARVSAITTALERLGQIKTFLKSFPTPKTYRKAGVSQDKWLEYHYGNYVIAVVSLSDLAVLLTNSAFRLGLRPRACNMNTVGRNGWVEAAGVKDSLVALNGEVAAFRERRNLHVHRGEAPRLHEILDSEIYDTLTMIQFVKSVRDFPDVDQAWLDEAFDEEVGRLTSLVQQETIDFRNLMADVFTSIEPVVRLRGLMLGGTRVE